MNGSIRVSAKTVDDAITEALIQLGVTSDRLEYEVIEKGSAGFLGIEIAPEIVCALLPGIRPLIATRYSFIIRVL